MSKDMIEISIMRNKGTLLFTTWPNTNDLEKWLHHSISAACGQIAPANEVNGGQMFYRYIIFFCF